MSVCITRSPTAARADCRQLLAKWRLDMGAQVQLETVPLKYPGLRPWEIWLSEAQERMVLAVPPQDWARVQAICAGQDVEAAYIGTFEATGQTRTDL